MHVSERMIGVEALHRVAFVADAFALAKKNDENELVRCGRDQNTNSRDSRGWHDDVADETDSRYVFMRQVSFGQFREHFGKHSLSQRAELDL